MRLFLTIATIFITTHVLAQKVYSIYNFKKPIKNNNDTISSYILTPKSNSSFSPFKKGLIHIISEVMQKGSNDTSSIFKNNKPKINQY